MDIQGAMYKYMLAHVRVNSRTMPEGFTPDEVLEMFATMKEPKRRFDEWCAIVGIEIRDEEREQANNETFANMSRDSGIAKK